MPQPVSYTVLVSMSDLSGNIAPYCDLPDLHWAVFIYSGLFGSDRLCAVRSNGLVVPADQRQCDDGHPLLSLRVVFVPDDILLHFRRHHQLLERDVRHHSGTSPNIAPHPCANSCFVPAAEIRRGTI